MMANTQSDTHARNLNNREEQTHKAAEAARAGVEKLADLRQQATENVRKSVQNGVDVTSRNIQNASDQFARTLGFTGEDSDRLARQSAQNMKAISQFGTVLTQAFQDTSREWYGLAQKQLQRNLEGMSKLAQCSSVQEFTTVQSGLIRESLRHMAEDSRAIAEISQRAVNDAGKAVAAAAQGNAAAVRPNAVAA
jgi:hypothetical protein